MLVYARLGGLIYPDLPIYGMVRLAWYSTYQSMPIYARIRTI